MHSPTSYSPEHSPPSSSRGSLMISTSPPAPSTPAKPPPNPWLNAWTDAVASLRTYSPLIRLADASGDGDYRCIVGDLSGKLKVYKGTSLQSEHTLLEPPCALASFYSDLNAPQIPNLAVAAGSAIYIYRNMRPYYKFSLPPVDLDVTEVSIWTQLKENTIQPQLALDQLRELRETGIDLSARSLDILNETDLTNQLNQIQSCKAINLIQLTVCTCMETLNKNLLDEKAVASLVVGTESKQLFIMDPAGTSILKKFNLPSPPALLAVSGTYDVEYRIAIACRNGGIYMVKKHKLLVSVIQLEAHAVGMVFIDKLLIVAGMDNVIHAYGAKGKKQYSLNLSDTITGIELLTLKRVRNVTALLVALANGEVRCYAKKQLLSILPIHDRLSAIKFGPYGREEAALIAVTYSGALTIKILQRSASFDPTEPSLLGPPPEQDIPLPVPKKTQLYIDQTNREKSQSVQMHRIFQKDLCQMRLTTARAYVKMILDGGGALSTVGGGGLKLECRLSGLGPNFALRLGIKNTGQKLITDMGMVIVFDKLLYKVPAALSKIPLILPGTEWSTVVQIESIDETGTASPLKVLIFNAKSAIPTLSAIGKI